MPRRDARSEVRAYLRCRSCSAANTSRRWVQEEAEHKKIGKWKLELKTTKNKLIHKGSEDINMVIVIQN